MRKTLLNSRMIDALTICNALDSAAETMTLREEAHWAAWLRYFLQVLEQNAGSNRAYQAFLERLQGDISSRLESGRW
jgi:N-glycosylase/DNA lyase